MIFMHGNLVIPTHQVDHGEDGSARCDGPEGLDVRDGVPVIASHGIESPVVPAWSPAIGFGDHM